MAAVGRDWPPGNCFLCGGDHTRDKCDKLKKRMQEANPGKPRKDWVPPVGYKSAIAKAREAKKAAAKAKAAERPQSSELAEYKAVATQDREDDSNA